MHIAFVISTLRGGGAERSVLELAAGLIHRGHRVDIVLFRNRIHYPAEVPESARLYAVEDRPDKLTEKYATDLLAPLGALRGPARRFDWVQMARALNWDLLCLPDRRMVRQVRAMASYMESEKPDCVLPSLPRAKVATLLAGHLLEAHPPIIPILHSFVRYRRLRYKRRYRHLFAEATHFIGVSHGVSDSLADTIGVPRDKVTTIYNPVVTPRLHAKMAQQPTHPWLLDGGPPVIVSAGRLVKEKDYPTLIRAFGRLASRRRCRLIIVGEGKLRGHLQGLVRKLGLSNQVSIPGWVENPFTFMAHASCFVLSSRHEGLGLALIEALACGCSCVSTDCPAGPAEILENGRFGLLVPVGDEAALADAMDRALHKPRDKQMSMDRAAHFSDVASVTAYEKLLGTLRDPPVTSTE